MLSKLVNFTNRKGDGKMNSKNSLLKLGMASLAFCLLLTAFLTGCGGSNSSGSATNAAAVNADGQTLPTTYSIRGKLVSDQTTQAPAAGVNIKLLAQDVVTSKFVDTGKSVVTLTSGEYSFTNLVRGIYVLSAQANASFQESQMLVIIDASNAEANVVTDNMITVPVGTPTSGEVTLKGKTVSDATGANPIGGLTITVSKMDSAGSWQLVTDKVAQTLTSGEFIFQGMKAGTYKLDISGVVGGVNKYNATSKLAIISTSNSLTELDLGNVVILPFGNTLTGEITLKGKIVTDSTGLTSISGLIVKLSVLEATGNWKLIADKVAMSLSNGEFAFTSLKAGTYKLDIDGVVDGINKYTATSKLAIISTTVTTEFDAGNIIVLPFGSIPTGDMTVKGKMVADSTGETPVGDLIVKLSIMDLDGTWKSTGKSAVTLSSGEFVFSQLETGNYKLDTDGIIGANHKYSALSKLVIVSSINNQTEIDAGNIVLTPVPNPITTIPTINLKGRVIDILASSPLSVALVSVDTGQSTVTDGFGMFELRNIEVGTRRLIITKQSMSSYTVSFEGKDTPTFTGIVLNNTQYPIISEADHTVDLFAQGLDFKITLLQHMSGSLMGTVKKFKIEDGVVSYKTEAKSKYEFELWQVFPDKSTARHSSVQSDEDGEWKMDNLPPYEDNSALWYAVAPGSLATVQQGQTGNVVAFTNTASEWAGRSPILANGYKIQAGQTTVMDFILPSFLYYTYATNVKPVEDAAFAAISTAIFPDDYASDHLTTPLKKVYFSWTPTAASQTLTLEFSRAYKTTDTSVIQQMFPSEFGKTNTKSFLSSSIGLDFGRFAWRTVVYDSKAPAVPIPSMSHLYTVIPSSEDLTPSSGTVIIQSTVASYTVTFMAPNDEDATGITMELYHVPTPNTYHLIANPAAKDISKSAVWSIEFPNGKPGAGDYQWRAIYYYSDGPRMTSEFAPIKFQ